MAASAMTAPSAKSVNLGRRRRLIAWVGTGVLVAMLLVAYQIRSSYVEARLDAATKAFNYTAIIEARLDATLRRTAAVLHEVVRELPGAMPEGAALAEGDAAVVADLDRALLHFPELAGLSLHDAKGRVIVHSSSRGRMAPTALDTALLQELARPGPSPAHFSHRVATAADGRQTVTAAQALHDDRGQLLGVAAADIDLGHFVELFQSLDVGPSGVVSIRRSDDFNAVLRWPPAPAGMAAVQRLQPGNSVRDAMVAGHRVGTQDFMPSPDGVVRTHSYRAVEGFPFFVLISLARDDVLAGWRTRSLAVGASGVLLMTLLLALLARLWRVHAREAQAAAALESSEERLRLALGAGPHGLYDLDFRTGNEVVNEAYARMLGHDPVRFVETRAAWLERLHPDDREAALAAFRAHADGTQPEYRAEFRLRHKDGHHVWVLSVGRIVERDAQGRPLRMLGTHLDISARQHAQQALLALAQQLESRVAERTAQLEAARDEAQRANRAKSEFLSGMSHELRTPLNAILGFGQLLDTDPEMARMDRQRTQVGQILRAGHHLLELINELLDLARIEVGKQAFRVQPLDLQPLAEDCLRLMAPQARDGSLRLAFTPLGEDARGVLADRTRLKQVLLNLLSNAVKYNRPGGLVSVGARREGTQVCVEVTDTGPGIAPERQRELFRAFERLDADDTDIPGAGIGLMLSKRLVELMDGRIGLRSEVGRGSTFWVQLPAAALEAARAAPPPHDAGALPAPPASAGEPETVLYVEDNQINVELVRALFGQRTDLRLISALHPEVGLEIARVQRPALILLDIELPGYDGYEMLRRLRADAQTRRIPVIAVTANAMPQDLRAGADAGFASYLTKPLDLRRLLSVVQQTLDQARADRSRVDAVL